VGLGFFFKREQRKERRPRKLFSLSRYRRGSVDALCIAFDVLLYGHGNTFYPYFSRKAKSLFQVSIKYDPSAHELTNAFGMNS
jgi:hypothetical protein